MLLKSTDYLSTTRTYFSGLATSSSLIDYSGISGSSGKTLPTYPNV
jgi:hypothetical protein